MIANAAGGRAGGRPFLTADFDPYAEPPAPPGLPLTRDNLGALLAAFRLRRRPRPDPPPAGALT